MKTNGLVGCAAIVLSICLSAMQLPAQDVAMRDLSTPLQWSRWPAIGVSYDDEMAESPAEELTLAESTTTEFEVTDASTTGFESFLNECCRCGCYDPHWYAGTEVLFLRTQSRTGGIITASFSDTTAPGVATIAFVERDAVNDWGVAPRMWIGRQFTPTWGARFSLFSFSESSYRFPELNPAIPTVGTNFATHYRIANIEARSMNIELVRSVQYTDNWKLDAFVGGCYGTLDIDNLHHSFGVFTTGNFVNLLLSNGSAFDGAGVALGFSSRHRLTGNLFLVWSGRGSRLWGHTDSFGRASGTVASSPNAPLLGAATVTRANAESIMEIIETSLGLQYEFQVFELPINAFVRTSFEFQYWNMDGPPTGGAGFGGTTGEITTNSFSSAGLGDAQFLGLSFATGFTW